VHVSVKPDCAGLFYNGLPESEQKHWSGILQTHGRKALEGRTEGASWKVRHHPPPQHLNANPPPN
jgi:hypothetical protein